MALRSSRRPVLVVGDSSSGKTALLSSWVLEYQERHPSCHVVSHFSGASPTCGTLETSLARIIDDISVHFGLEDRYSGKTSGKTRSLDLAELRSQFVDVLHAAGQRGSLAVVCDGFYQLPSTSLSAKADLQAWVPTDLPDGVSILSLVPCRSVVSCCP